MDAPEIASDVPARPAIPSLRRPRDPELAEGHAILASVYYQEDDVKGADAECRRALELNPSLPEPYFVLSNVAFLRGDVDGGVRASEMCYRLPPVPRQSLGRRYSRFVA